MVVFKLFILMASNDLYYFMHIAYNEKACNLVK
jgi:hypothetical protein